MKLAILELCLLLLSTQVAASIATEKDQIEGIARQIVESPKPDVAEYAEIFQKLASVLGDQAAVKGLEADTKSAEFAIGLRDLLADVKRSMWVFNDDKEMLDYLRILASTIKTGI